MPPSAEDARHDKEAPALGTSSEDARVFRVELTDPGTFYRPAQMDRQFYRFIVAAFIFAFAAAVSYFVPSPGPGLFLFSLGAMMAASYWFVARARGQPAIRAVVFDLEASEIRLDVADGSTVHLPRSAVDDVRIIEKSVPHKGRTRAYHRTFFTKGEIPVFGNLFLSPKVRKAMPVVDACVALMEVLDRVPPDGAREDAALDRAWARLERVPRLTVRGRAPTRAWDPQRDGVDITFEPDRTDRHLIQSSAVFGFMTAILVAFAIGFGDCGNDAPVATIFVWLGLVVAVVILRARSILASRSGTLRVRVDGYETVIAIETNGVASRAQRWRTSELHGIDSRPVGHEGVPRLTVRETAVADLSNATEMPGPHLDVSELPLAVAIDIEVILNAAVQRVRAEAKERAKGPPAQAVDAS